MRSRAAAATLSQAGFKKAYSMEGGIRAWKGLVAKGAPESGMAYFSPAAKPEELIALAWALEGGSRKFYSELAAALKDPEAGDLFRELTAAEDRHQASLLSLYKEMSGESSDSQFGDLTASLGLENDVMEGGMRVSEGIKWSQGQSVAEILELSLALESNSYDLYLKMERQERERNEQRPLQVFRLLSGEEKKHLERLSSLLEKRV